MVFATESLVLEECKAFARRIGLFISLLKSKTARIVGDRNAATFSRRSAYMASENSARKSGLMMKLYGCLRQ